MRRSAFALILAALLLLSGCGAGQGDCRILVSNEAGQPVSGVVLQLCTEDRCVMETTDEAGCVRFRPGEDEWTVHVLKAPEGYQCPEEDLPLSAQELVILLPGA